MSLVQALFAYFLRPILSLLILVIFIRVIMSWLISFQIINLHNRFVAAVWDISGRITEPLIRPIRNILPPMGGMDFSPIILLLALYFTRDWLLPSLLFGGFRLF
jgi:YggT family protein